MTYNINMAELKNLIKDYTRQAFNNLTVENKSQNICAFALVTDGSVMTLSARANTMSNLKDIENGMERAEKTWITDEWSLEDMSSHGELDTFLDKAEEVRFSEEYHHDDDMFRDYRKSYLEACITVLEELQKENAIPRSDDFITLVQITDDNQVSGMFGRLNTLKHKQAYEAFID